MSAGNHFAEVVLGYDFYCEVVFEYVDIGVAPYGFDQTFLDFKPGVVGMVEYAEFRMPPLAVEVEGAVSLAVEVHAPVKKLPDLVGRTLDYFPHRLRIAQPVAGYHRIMYMFVEIVDLHIGDRRHPALCKGGVCFIEGCFAYQCHFPF